MKILVSDFDYTFFSLDYLDNIHTVQKFVNEDNIFMIATGRNLAQILEDVKDLYVPYFFLICNDGAIIYDRKNSVLDSKPIAHELVEPLFNTLSKSRYVSEVFIDNTIEYSVSTDEEAFKIIAKPTHYEKAKKLLQSLLTKYPQIDGYISENWMNITNKDASKGEAIEYLLEKFHLNSEDVYVVGDNVNDISMFEKYKGYAMDTAEDSIKKKCLGSVKTLPELIEIINKD